jgi:type III pantothenate kinase
LYFGNRAALDGLTRQIRDRMFRGQPALVIATGGFSRLFEGDRLFDVFDPDLVLVGLERALALNTTSAGSKPS